MPYYNEQYLLDVSKFTDEWTALEAAKQQREYMREVRRDERRRMIWTGFGYSVGGFIALALVLAVIYTFWSSADRNGERSVMKEREQSKQLQACTSLEAPAERQLCIVGLVGKEESD